MASIPLVCPLDGTRLGTAAGTVVPVVRGDILRDAPHHIHIDFTFDLSCQNALPHRWRCASNLTLERVP